MHDHPPSLDKTTATNQVLDDLLAEISEKLHAGEAVDAEEYASRHPELAEPLRRMLPAMRALADLGVSASRGGALGASSAQGADSVRGELGDFRILREIGRGGMGVVYEAEQISLGRRLALKVLPFAAMLDPRQLQRFRNEAQAAAALNHPNIVGIHSVGCERGVHYYAMQYIEGRTLAQVIEELRSGQQAASPPHPVILPPSHPVTLSPGHPVTLSPGHPVTRSPCHSLTPAPDTQREPQAAVSTKASHQTSDFFRLAARLGVRAAEALEHAHQMGVVHRDIKPSNLMVDDRGQLWITDFGLAQITTPSLLGGEGRGEGQSLTMTGDIVGTLRYMSPEQALGKRSEMDRRTDIYSLGVTLYELLTLQPAFAGDNRETLVRRLLEEDPPRPKTVNGAIPRDLETIILKATAKEPQQRYASAQEMADDLKRFLADEPIRARRPSLADRAGKWARRHRTVVWSAAALLVLGTLGSAISTLMIARERTRTVEALEAETAQRLRAEENLRMSLDALDQVYLKFAEKEAKDLLVGPEDEARLERELTPEDTELLKKALAFYEEFVRVNRDEPSVRLEAARAYGRVGGIRQKLKMPKEADEAASQAVELAQRLAAEFPESPGCRDCLVLAYKERGWIRREQGEFDKAIADYSEVLRLSPNDLAARRERGRAYLGRGRQQRVAGQRKEAITDYDQAIRDTTEAIQADPNYANGYHIRGDAYFHWGLLDSTQFENGIADYTTAIRLKPSFVWSYYNRGLIYSEQGHLDKALADFNQGLQLEKTPRPFGLFQRGGVYRKMGQVDRALADYNEVLRLDPISASAYNNRGAIYCDRKGDFERAVADFTEAIRLDPKRALFRSNRGLAYRKKGDLDKAIADWQKLVDLAPEDAPAGNNLAWFLATCPDAALREPEWAVKLAEKATQSAPKEASHWNTLGAARYRAGDWKGAIEALERSMQLDKGGNAFDWFFLAMAHWQLNQKDDARRWYDKAAAWMDKNAPKDEELLRFRAEAAGLLGIKEKPLRAKE